MSYAAAVTGGAAVLGYLGQGQNADAQAAANQQNVALSQEQLAQQQQQFEATQAQQGQQFGSGQALTREQFGYGAAIGNERATSKRGYAGEQLGQYSQAGQAASREQSALLGLGTPQEQEAAMSNFGNSPGQRFMRERAEKALVRNAGRLGGLGGGNVRSALVEQGVGFAAQDYDRQFNRLGQMSAQGQQAGQTMTAQDLGVSSTAATLGTQAAADTTQRQAEEEFSAAIAGEQFNENIRQNMRDREAARVAEAAPAPAANVTFRGSRGSSSIAGPRGTQRSGGFSGGGGSRGGYGGSSGGHGGGDGQGGGYGGR